MVKNWGKCLKIEFQQYYCNKRIQEQLMFKSFKTQKLLRSNITRGLFHEKGSTRNIINVKTQILKIHLINTLRMNHLVHLQQNNNTQTNYQQMVFEGKLFKQEGTRINIIPIYTSHKHQLFLLIQEFNAITISISRTNIETSETNLVLYIEAASST